MREVSPGGKARTAGVFYLLAVLTAVSGESFLRGRLSYAAGLIAVACFVVVTLVLYGIFKPVNGRLASLAAASGLVGLSFEALRWNPWGVDVAMAFHGLYCLLIGYLVFRSTFLPRILGVLMAFAGLAWMMTLLSQRLVVCGFLGEGALMLWLLVMGVNVPRWKELPGGST